MRPGCKTGALLAAIGLVAACAEIEGLGEGDAEAPAVEERGDDALVGRVGGGRDGGLPRPGDLGADGAPASGCHPGERLALCTLCGVDRQPRAAEDDAECPPVDCAALDRFEEVADGADSVCSRRAHRPQGGTCAGPGRCVDDPAARCAPDEPVEVARAVGPCRRLTGCLAGAPVVANAITGTACNGAGACREDGTCSVGEGAAACAGLPGLGCEHGVHGDGTPYCEVYVRAGGGKLSCDDYCAAQGTRCLAAWRDRDDGCEHDGASPCGERHGDVVCRCAAPGAR